ncbi:tetratricopeptide repeat protein [Virgibacillus halodenitrificans]|uniref:tetratricopeptide repeat protein n=1 Tax=Virgibacillus halodenitrificans TaxID=1482 RepID=UPI002DBF5ED4|nr:hypothetical protein [Virgibacillus halodenitrificans]MEC2158528.1 hypothetical protein [Virgibacillus halodenitrificans]
MSERNFIARISMNLKKHAKNLFCRLTMKRDEYQFLERAKKYRYKNDVETSIGILKQGIDKYPGTYQLHSELVDIAMKKKDWDLAVCQWETIYKLKKGRLKSSAFVRFAKSLKYNKNITRAEEILTKGSELYPTDYKIQLELAFVLTNQRKWKKAIGYWDKLFIDKNSSLSSKAYLKAALSYTKLNLYKHAETIIEKGIEVYPKDKILLEKYADLAIYQMDWRTAINRFENIKNLSYTSLMKVSMLYQIVAEFVKSDYYFQIALNTSQALDENNEYKKITLFDNGESRIEFYKKTQSTDRVVITFDSINLDWNGPPFAYKLLAKQNVDIIAVRKRLKKTYQQDLSIAEFTETVSPLVSGYNDRIAYGFSLGAYAALYFASHVDCRILAISPRLSIHPTYGRTKIIPKYEFRHEYSHTYNANITPIIVFDPKNALDNKYVSKELIKSFPKAKLVKVPYGGHGMAPHLLKMGILKEFVLTFINDKGVPKYDRKKKSKSSIYFRLLGNECLKHNKLKWALDLAERSLNLSPHDKHAIKLKINTLKKLNRYDTAISYALEVINILPNLLEIRVLLIDLFIDEKDFRNAKNTIYEAKKIFKSSQAIKKREQKIALQEDTRNF